MLFRGVAGRWLHPSFCAALLSDLFGLQLRAGCACAGPYGLSLLSVTDSTAASFERTLAAAGGALGEALRPAWLRLSLSAAVNGGDAAFAVAALLSVAEHGWRLLPEYAFSPVTGEWAHASRISKFPDRAWLASMRWPLDADSSTTLDGGGGGGGAAASPPPSEAEEAQQRADMLARAAELFNAARAAGAAAGAAAPPDVGSPAERSLRWFCLPEEAAAALAAEGPRDAIAPRQLPRAGCEGAWFAALAAEGEASPRATPARPAGPIQPADYAASAVAGGATPPPPAWELHPQPGRMVETHTACWRSAATSAGPAHAQPGVLAALAFGPAAAAAAAAAADEMDSSDQAGGASSDSDEEADAQPSPAQAAPAQPAAQARPRLVVPPRKLLACVARTVAMFGMIREGDRLLVGLSGGKDSLSLLHILLHMAARSPVRFSVAAATVDPGADGFDPTPLIGYCASLGVRYHYLENTIMADAAAGSMSGDSICSFCARMKRGALYRCAREHGYSALALGQHADDIVESLLLSAFHNGALRTMKACYAVDGGLRVIRPLAAVRERDTRDFAYAAGLPVIPDNCPACFAAPKQRARVKQLLRRECRTFPQLFSSLASAALPLLDERVPPLLRATSVALEARKNANKGAAARGSSSLTVQEHLDVRLEDVDSETLAAELRRRGGVALSPAALAAAGAEDEAEEAAQEVAAAQSAGACAMPRRPPAGAASAADCSA
jgi:tRNA(Ile)-lysidine synthase TilS/MesJ